jgi:HPt (histidine-containing phosphotransfer) domain-containing protein
MASGKTEIPAVTAFHDHEVITPPHRLQNAVLPAGADDDPIARAEQALAGLSGEFADWMDQECARLDKERRRVREEGLKGEAREALFRAAHDIKGAAATYGFPLAAAAAESLCRLIEHTPAEAHIPLALVDQHVDAVRAIVREHAIPDAAAMAGHLTTKLRQLTDKFLKANGYDEVEASPSIAPGDSTF